MKFYYCLSLCQTKPLIRKPLELSRDVVPTAPEGIELDKPCLGIFISHSHQDHHGLLDILPEDWPIYCGRATWDLLSLDAAMRGSAFNKKTVFWDAQIPFTVGPFLVTPLLVDHSAFDAYFLLIEVDGKRILYTGDFRDQGRKGTLTRRILENPPNDVDVLIMEGTNLLGPEFTEKETRSESELEDEFAKVFKDTSGRIFVSAASTNIDRIVTLFRACKKSDRVLVVDLYTMIVLRMLGKYASLPQPEWEDVSLTTVVTSRMLRLAERLGYPGLVEDLKNMGKAMSARRLAEDKNKWVAMIRSSMVDDYKSKGVIPDDEDVWIWSLWDGYLREDGQKVLLDYFSGKQPCIIHTSGHASPETLVKMATAINPTVLIPVHGTEWQNNTGLFGDVPVRIVSNGEHVPV